jgi:glutamate dehydrogenase/leucine dehydrogenase
MTIIELPAVDVFGPEQIVVVNDAATGLTGYVVVDNLAAGPAIGGVRMAADISVIEVARLARAMTLKNAMAGLPHGGAKGGIVGDPTMPRDVKIALVRAFGTRIRDVAGYIPGPDMGLDEGLMAHLRDACGRAVGLPTVLGGIPLDVLGATGFGLAVSAEVAAERGFVDLDGARVVVQGFGSVGQHTARFLAERGARLVGASDSRSAVASPAGLDVAALIGHKEATGAVAGFAGAEAVSPEALLGLPCDIWVPAARPDVFTVTNVDRLQAKIVLEGANIPASPEAEELLHSKGVLVLPDFVANSGGVICAAVEYAGGTAAQAFATIEERIRANTGQMLDAAFATSQPPRVVALQMAQERVVEAMSYRR